MRCTVFSFAAASSFFSHMMIKLRKWCHALELVSLNSKIRVRKHFLNQSTAFLWIFRIYRRWWYGIQYRFQKKDNRTWKTFRNPQKKKMHQNPRGGGRSSQGWPFRPGPDISEKKLNQHVRLSRLGLEPPSAFEALVLADVRTYSFLSYYVLSVGGPRAGII